MAMMPPNLHQNKKNMHPITTFHMVNMSPWPLIVPIISSSLLVAGLGNFNSTSLPFHLKWFSLLMMMLTTLWWRDVIRESTIQGHHTSKVQINMSMSMIMFILSEVMFFFAFFWAFFHSSLSPSYQVGSIWPPAGVHPLNPFSTPLLNTGVLLSSGVLVTWSHHSIINNNLNEASTSLKATIALGIYFTLLQWSEYQEAAFSIHDSVYGSTFFLATGFHGAHVLIGTTFLSTCLARLTKLHYSSHHHFGFEAAAWYWHFVDVVWIFLYVFIYWWASS